MNRLSTLSASTLLAVSTATAAPGAGPSAELRPATSPASAAVHAARTPSPELQLLAELAGDYVLTTRFWPGPGAEPVASQLPAERRLALGGRVLRLEVGPDTRGFRGTGLLGYDEAAGRFWYVWTDTSTSGVAFLEGSLGRDGTGQLEGTRPTREGRAPLRIEIRREGRGEVHDYRVPSEGDGDVRYLELRYEPRE